MTSTKPLTEKIAVVAGATRHAGRGIAIELGIAGATVYCTGRSTTGLPSPRNKPETIEETAALVEAHGGIAIPVRVDHTVVAEVDALFDRVIQEHGRLDLVVNSIGGHGYQWGKPFWECDLESSLQSVTDIARAHLITASLAALRMKTAGHGLIAAIGDADHNDSLSYAVERSLINRISRSGADDLRQIGVAIVSLLPGGFFQCFDIMTAEALRIAQERDPTVADCHTPRLIGRAVVALSSDPDIMHKTGSLLAIQAVVDEYGLTDLDGRRTGKIW